MKVIEIDERFKDLWDEIAGKEKVGSFLQSYAWGEFKKSLNKKVFRLIVSDIKTDIKEPLVSHFKILAQAQVIKEEIPIFGPFLYIPHGPIFNTNLKEKVFGVLSQKLIQIAKNENCFMIRMEPKEDLDFANLKKFPSALQAPCNLKINLEPPLERILNSFKQKTRYNIRLAERKGVKIRRGSKKDFGAFLKLLKLTAQRNKFDLHPDEYNLKLFDTFLNLDMGELLLAEAKNIIIAGFFVIFFKSEATYFYGASSDVMRNFMPTYALMWEAIKRAKERGCKTLDMRGVSCEENNPKDPWYGLTRFKRGFAPREEITVYPGTFFLIQKPLKFYFYLLQRVIRKKAL